MGSLEYYHRKTSDMLLYFTTPTSLGYAGFGTTLSAYGFDLTACFLYSLGGKAYDTGYSRLISPLRLSTMPGEPRTLLTNMPDIWGMPWPTVPLPTST